METKKNTRLNNKNKLDSEVQIYEINKAVAIFFHLKKITRIREQKKIITDRWKFKSLFKQKSTKFDWKLFKKLCNVYFLYFPSKRQLIKFWILSPAKKKIIKSDIWKVSNKI